MNIQIYVSKKNFDSQKAERFFKERKIPYQLMDLKKHKLGLRELELFAKQLGIDQLVDYEDKRVKEHPVGHTNIPSVILETLQEKPVFLRSPIVRNGNKVTLGEAPQVWKKWIEEGK